MKINMDGLKGVKLEKDMLAQARKQKISFTTFLENYLVKEKQVIEDSPYLGKSPSEIVKYKKNCVRAGKNPESTGFDLMLEAHGIKAFGQNTDKVNKFFATGTSSILYPEWINTVVYYDHLDTSVVESLISNVIVIDGYIHKKRKIEDVTTDGKFEMGETPRGAAFPEMNVELSEVDSHLRKYGTILNYNYEDIENMTLNQFRSEVLSIVARKIALAKSARVIYALLNGDGVSTGLPAGNIETATVAGSIGRNDIMNFITATSQGYQINAAVTPIAYWRKYHTTLSEMTNPAAQKAEMNIPFPTVQRWDGSYLTADYILGVDNRYACAWFTNDNMMMDESEKIITNQTVRQVLSIRGEVVILNANAIGALDCA